ncbi:MAG TPA: lysophospholipid acyltransferase family protein [Kofleriaceae bacterium]|nr:lysophospholipid acyltransferase family protein [Kofleriaceae bacterium]
MAAPTDPAGAGSNDRDRDADAEPDRGAGSAELTRTERLALRLARAANTHPVGQALQQMFLRGVSYNWVRAGIAHRCLFDGLDELIARTPERGVLLASNHRSFFDQYAMLLALYLTGTPWCRRINFPVRANFFYEHPLGMLVNWGVAAGVMYPPVFRQRERSEANKQTLDELVSMLQEPGVVVGVHPEGTRGKGPDPYQLLPAMPGIGQIALQAKPMVIPAFVLGMNNDIVREIRDNFRGDIRRTRPVIAVFGEPVDYSPFLTSKPRPALYKKCADLIRQRIIDLEAREKELRAQCAAGEIADDDPRWLTNRPHSKWYASLRER